MDHAASGVSEGTRIHIPALIEFPDAGHVRLLAAIVGQEPDKIAIGMAVRTGWVSAANVVVPVFTVA